MNLLSSSPTIPGWLSCAGRQVLLTQSARTAIALLRDALSLSRDDEVLVPAYNCGTEIDALLAADLAVRCVDTDERGFLSLKELEGALGPRTRAIYVTHLFGWPQPLDEIEYWRREKGLLLIEDCALSLFSNFPGGSPVGSKGEASVFSLPKSLPTPDGGALTWSTDWVAPTKLRRPGVHQSFRPTISRILNWARRHFPQLAVLRRPGAESLAASPNEILCDMPQDYYFESRRRGCTSSTLTKKLLPEYEPHQIKDRRRRNYQVLKSALLQDGFELLFNSLDDGVCPLSCPVVVRQRDFIASYLTRIGIDVPHWWAGGHRRIDWMNFPKARELKQTILPLPVHQRLEEADMRFIAGQIREARDAAVAKAKQFGTPG